MPASRSLLIFGALALLSLARSFADGGENGVSPTVAAPSNPSDCPGRPSNATPVEYKVLLAQRILSTKRLVPEVLPKPDSMQAINVQGRQQIQDEADYQSVFGGQSSGIDWSLYRIVIVPLLTTYKLDQLDSTEALSGISQTSDAIYIGLTFTQVGPCQGIAQLDEWFSYDRLNYFVVVPKTPERITFYTCVVGGCPPDIP
jgi:hypothetical protein